MEEDQQGAGVESSQSVETRANNAMALSRTLERRPELRQGFINAFDKAENNGKLGIALTADIVEEYNKASGGGGFTTERARNATSRIINNLNESISRDNGLTLEATSEFYDGLNLNEPFLDGNKRASILALTHVLSSHGYPAPDFSNSSHQRLSELQQQNPGRKQEATKQFLMESLPAIPPSRQMVA